MTFLLLLFIFTLMSPYENQSTLYVAEVLKRTLEGSYPLGSRGTQKVLAKNQL